MTVGSFPPPGLAFCNETTLFSGHHQVVLFLTALSSWSMYCNVLRSDLISYDVDASHHAADKFRLTHQAVANPTTTFIASSNIVHEHKCS